MLRHNRKSSLLLIAGSFILFTLIIYILIYHQNAVGVAPPHNAVQQKYRNRIEEHLLKWRHVVDDNKAKRESIHKQAATHGNSNFDGNDINVVATSSSSSSSNKQKLSVSTAGPAKTAQQLTKQPKLSHAHKHNFFHNKQQRKAAAELKRLKALDLSVAVSSSSDKSSIADKGTALEPNKDNNLQSTGFNVKLSEKLPLKRFVPDTRHER